jgi:hypothetical protein
MERKTMNVKVEQKYLVNKYHMKGQDTKNLVNSTSLIRYKLKLKSM